MPGDPATTPLFDRAMTAIYRLVMRALSGRLAYLGVYPGAVLGQSGQTVDVICDDTATWPNGFKGIPLRYGLPDTNLTVPNGARVLVAFDNWDPAKPYAALWDVATVTAMILANSGSPAAAARNGDSVDIGTFSVTGLIFNWVSPSGSVVPLFTLVPGTGGASLTPGPPVPPELSGKISSGSSKVKIG